MGKLEYLEDSWLGETPTNWPIIPAKVLFSNPVEKSYPNDVHLTPSQKYGVLPQADYMEITGNRVVLNLSGADNMRHMEAGDFVSHLRSFQGGLEYSPFAGKVSAAYTVLRPRREIDHRFYKYLFKSSRYVQGLATTTEQLRDGQSIRYEQFALLPLPFPPLEEQKSIADFLDKELKQLDDLTRTLNQFTTVLEERLQATFRELTRAESHSPKPEGWTVRKLGSLFTTIGSGTTPTAGDESNFGGEVPWVTTGELRENLILETERSITEHALRNFSALRVYPAGSLVMALYGATIGRLAFLGIPATVNQACCVMAGPKDVEPRFIYYALQASRDNLMASAVGAGQPNISQEIVRQFKLTIPPLEKQKLIVSQLDGVVAATSGLLTKAQQMLETLRQRRTALISHTVTGKLDVQGKK